MAVMSSSGAPRIKNYNEGKAETTQRKDINLLEEHCITAALQHAWYEQQLKRYHDQNVQERDFNTESSQQQARTSYLHPGKAPLL
jgi:O-succinylbenzoate synthase